MARYALLVGINYENTRNELRGCVNDVILMNQLLRERLGFSDPATVRILTNGNATAAAIKDQLNWLVSDCAPGDVLYFHYSGHGTQVIDLDYNTEEEPDGLDEVIVPIDMNWTDRMVTDDDFRDIFAKLPERVNLTVTLDCCHSGGGLRDFLPVDAPVRNRYIQAPPDVITRGYGQNLPVKPLGVEIKEQLPGVLLAAARSDQTAADAWIQPARRYHGAMTWQLFTSLQHYNYDVSHDELVGHLRTAITRDGYTQLPELNCRDEYVTRKFLNSF